MIRLLLPILLLLLIVWALKYARQLPPAQKRKFWLKIGLTLAVAGVVALTLTGRIHWIGAVLAACIPLAGRGINLAMKIIPLWLARKTNTRQEQSQNSTQQSNNSGSMSENEAMEVLGLTQPYNKEDIVEAHRKLMQRVHPDRGGSDHLAAKVNQAKESLIKSLTK